MVIIREPVARRRQANLNQLFIVSDDGNTSAHAVFLCAVVIGGAVVAIVTACAADACRRDVVGFEGGEHAFQLGQHGLKPRAGVGGGLVQTGEKRSIVRRV